MFLQVDLTKVIETHVFQFDDAFGHEVTNEEIYSRTVKHLMGVLFDLGKASCFAYGQTGKEAHRLYLTVCEGLSRVVFYLRQALERLSL